MPSATRSNVIKHTDLTKGSIWRSLVNYTLPLLLGNLFQQLYNTIDSIVVGNYIGKEALAAVGSSGSLISMFVSLFMGISVGAGVVISRYFGAKRYEDMNKTIQTTIAFGLISGIFLTILGVTLTPIFLEWMGTPESVMENSVLYFRIYFLGIIFTLMYNFGSGIFRAVGDSRRPLYYLIVSTILNILLDLLFVAIFNMGIAGVAIATVIAQAVSCVLTYMTLIKDDAVYKLNVKDIRMHKDYIGNIIKIGLPSGIQNAIVSFSNVIVQTNINSFGDNAMAGCGAYAKVDGFALMPSGSFSMALSTFVSQNLGAKQYDRAKKGAIIGLGLTMAVTQIIGIFIYFFAPQVIPIFNSDPAVVEYGTMMARNVVFGYFLVSFSHGMGGVLRGAGLSKVPMFVMIGCWCALRIAWLEIMVPLTNDIHTVFWGYPLTWLISGIIFIIYFLKVDWLHKKEL